MMKNAYLVKLTGLILGKNAKYSWVLSLFLALCFNAFLASVIYGATGEAMTRTTAYAVGILVLVTVSLSCYLFVVIFQPERF
ncbi:K+-transporting ATPase, F subunit [Rippkaea orientalis PCC 8801]|uniref:K+-transporting ATPase, F subunit n=1 Tax=Rippkaea orientalis (strain PCC 8801 / RF-1) TaxID=41431 RepID=B7JY06_RIPO1|nr:potassium-transporting ATPase subunit F [Rippkaea orientalis]ACK65970.1 K+-transporting ATPase, F subunit [Rippkaea orientalis PCC 8801]